MLQPVVAVLVDPDPDRARDRVVLAGEIVDRAALAVCRPTHPDRLRWQFGRWTACADHLADAISAGREVGVL